MNCPNKLSFYSIDGIFSRAVYVVVIDIWTEVAGPTKTNLNNNNITIEGTLVKSTYPIIVM